MIKNTSTYRLAMAFMLLTMGIAGYLYARCVVAPGVILVMEAGNMRSYSLSSHQYQYINYSQAWILEQESNQGKCLSAESCASLDGLWSISMNTHESVEGFLTSNGTRHYMICLQRRPDGWRHLVSYHYGFLEKAWRGKGHYPFLVAFTYSGNNDLYIVDTRWPIFSLKHVLRLPWNQEFVGYLDHEVPVNYTWKPG